MVTAKQEEGIFSSIIRSRQCVFYIKVTNRRSKNKIREGLEKDGIP